MTLLKETLFLGGKVGGVENYADVRLRSSRNAFGMFISRPKRIAFAAL